MHRIPTPKERVLQYFLSNVGKVLEATDIQAIGGGFDDWERKVRSLRYHDGYQIITHKDRTSLIPSQYVLDTVERRPIFARGISRQNRAWVLDNMQLTCYMRGYAAGDADQVGAIGTVRLRIGHIVKKSDGGDDAPDNIRPLCTNCYEGMRKVSIPKPDLIYVFTQIRRSTIPDQKAVLEWLLQKFRLEVTAERTS